jgi:hypothetical protein
MKKEGTKNQKHTQHRNHSALISLYPSDHRYAFSPQRWAKNNSQKVGVFFTTTLMIVS